MDASKVAARGVQRRDLERGELRPSSAVRMAAGTVVVLLAVNLLLNQAPHAWLEGLALVRLSSRATLIVLSFGLVAAAAAGVAACALGLDPTLRRVSRLGRIATVVGTVGAIIVCLGIVDLGSIHLHNADGWTAGSPRHPPRHALTGLSGAPMLVGAALTALWLLVLAWLGHRRGVLGPGPGTAAGLAGAGFLTTAALFASSSFGLHTFTAMLLGTAALAVWAYMVATMPSRRPRTAGGSASRTALLARRG